MLALEVVLAVEPPGADRPERFGPVNPVVPDGTALEAELAATGTGRVTVRPARGPVSGTRATRTSQPRSRLAADRGGLLTHTDEEHILYTDLCSVLRICPVPAAAGHRSPGR